MQSFLHRNLCSGRLILAVTKSPLKLTEREWVISENGGSLEALSIRVPLNRLPRLINRQVVDLQRRGNPLIVEKHQTLDTLLSSDSHAILTPY